MKRRALMPSAVILFSIVAIVLLLAASASASVTGNLETGSGGTITFTLSSIVFNTDPSGARHYPAEFDQLASTKHPAS